MTAIAIKVTEKPSRPLRGVKATIANVENAVNNAPKISGAKFLIFGRHGFVGFITSELIIPS
jgi:hypothetical protein